MLSRLIFWWLRHSCSWILINSSFFFNFWKALWVRACDRLAMDDGWTSLDTHTFTFTFTFTFFDAPPLPCISRKSFPRLKHISQIYYLPPPFNSQTQGSKQYSYPTAHINYFHLRKKQNKTKTKTETKSFNISPFLYLII